MHSTNHQCNAFESLVGIFLHSYGAPETIHKFLACVGLSVSISTINEAVNHLSQEAVLEIERKEQTLLTSYVYDNLDINLKHTTPTIKQSMDTLVHLMTATMLSLYSGITTNNLNCTKIVWKQSYPNAGSSQL